ncbi:hypothetical protein AVEN_243642-1 [Araneus ventricosus]|uniref:Uncharacterized protein n=1 Tax=Araneus ventricosus TaxID=182803 RepID=A0A4Y2A5Y6_ARAVE|nr:hypothetical protein AVEN_243642-1 [Araneus ventricosus]
MVWRRISWYSAGAIITQQDYIAGNDNVTILTDHVDPKVQICHLMVLMVIKYRILTSFRADFLNTKMKFHIVHRLHSHSISILLSPCSQF